MWYCWIHRMSKNHQLSNPPFGLEPPMRSWIHYMDYNSRCHCWIHHMDENHRCHPKCEYFSVKFYIFIENIWLEFEIHARSLDISSEKNVITVITNSIFDQNSVSIYICKYWCNNFIIFHNLFTYLHIFFSDVRFDQISISIYIYNYYWCGFIIYTHIFFVFSNNPKPSTPSLNLGLITY